MKVLWRWTKRLLFVLAICITALLLPIAYVELGCRGGPPNNDYKAILPEEFHRPETRTFLTYPEWHIVHAYEDYAEVIRTNDPHDFGYLKSIGGFWSSLCSLSKVAMEHGEIDGPTKQMVYVIGASFTVELLLKAAYEETIGRVFVALRGDARTPLDDLSAHQAKSYAEFLQQVPWYKWRFQQDAIALNTNVTKALRDQERRLALGLEYRTKAAYANMIAQAVATVGNDALRLRMVVRGDSSPDVFVDLEGVDLIENSGGTAIIETPRYRALTHLLNHMAKMDLNFVEIAGNDDILVTLLSKNPNHKNSIYSAPRQGHEDYRHLVLLKVQNLANELRKLPDLGARLEHVHDF